MASWFNKITADSENYQLVLDAIEHYEEQLSEARKEVYLIGNLEKLSAALPGIVEYRFSQLQEIEAILEHLNIRLTKVKGKKFREYLEHYNRALTSRDAEKYAETDEEVLVVAEIVNAFSLVRNKYLGILKGIENKSYQLNNIVKLRAAGMEDADIGKIYIPKIE